MFGAKISKIKMKKIKNNIKIFLLNIQEIVNFLFSFKGSLNVVEFIMVLLVIRALFYPLGSWVKYSLQFSYLIDLVLFYCVIVAVQKRCRDFGSRGTWWLLAVSLTMLFDKACHFIDIQKAEILWKDVRLMTLIMQIVVFLPLFLIPSQQEKIAAEERSFLLKYPLLYVFICWSIAIAATLTVNHYAGISVALL